MVAVADSTTAALTVHTSGRNRPVASANPATAPDGSAAGTWLTANAVPEVPIETTTSPGSRPRPSAAPMLSPVPAEITVPSESAGVAGDTGGAGTVVGATGPAGRAAGGALAATVPTASPGLATRGSRTGCPSSQPGRSCRQPLPGGRREIPGAGRVA